MVKVSRGAVVCHFWGVGPTKCLQVCASIRAIGNQRSTVSLTASIFLFSFFLCIFFLKKKFPGNPIFLFFLSYLFIHLFIFLWFCPFSPPLARVGIIFLYLGEVGGVHFIASRIWQLFGKTPQSPKTRIIITNKKMFQTKKKKKKAEEERGWLERFQ